MSKINELIQTLCPDGVEYKTLKDVLTIKNGRDYKSFNQGNVPVYGSGGIMAYVDTYAYDGPSVLIPRKGSLSNIFYVEGQFWTVDTIFYTIIDESQVLPKYVFYYLQNAHLEKLNQAGGVPSLSQSVLNPYPIPVPPPSVQEEIVRILDEYTDLEAELEAKLLEEIELKRKQYEVYRDELLTFGDNVERKRLGDKSLFKISRGVVISKPYVKEHSGKYPVYSSQTENDGCLGCIDTYAVDGERVTWTTDGAKAGTVFYRNGKYNITNVCGMIECLNATKINCKYLSYVFSIVAPNYVNKGMGNPKLMSNIVELIEIPVPSLQEQERIVKILDKYATYTRDMISALNTELESRKKQYAYYRDQLLTFKRKEV